MLTTESDEIDNSPPGKRKRVANRQHPAQTIDIDDLETFPWQSGGHGSSCTACGEGGILLCCEICPNTYHLNCAVPPLQNIPEDDWYCPSCIDSHASRSTFLYGSELDSSHLKSCVLLFCKKRWRTCIILQPPEKGILLIKWWRSDNRGGTMIRVNVANNKILLLPPDIQEIMKEKAKYIISNDNYSNERYEYIKKEIKDKGKKIYYQY